MIVESWGEIPYSEATEKQLHLVKNFVEDTLVFCTHPPVVTLGRGTLPGDVYGWKGEVQETGRGGRATYHGPNQVVGYPIINLDNPGRINLKSRDLHGYLRALESALVSTLNRFDIEAEARTVKADANSPSLTGVWVRDTKIASIGIAVKKWITYHGFAINLYHGENDFVGINPCGFRSEVMTSVEKIIGQKPDRSEFQKVIAQELDIHLS